MSDTTDFAPLASQDFLSVDGSLKVLIVDDSQTIRSTAQQILGDGFQVQSCDDGFAALAKLASFRPDIIFIDIVMPRLDGYETVALLRTNREFDGVPVVMMSSRGGAFDVAKGRLIGCNDYIVKPFSKDDLAVALRQSFPDRTFFDHEVRNELEG